MIWHTLGWITVASQAGLGVAVVRYLIHAGRESRTWLRKLPTPVASAVPLCLSSGSDYVGVV